MVVTCFKVYHRNRPQLLLMPVRTAQTPHPNGPDWLSERFGRGASLWVASLKIKRKLKKISKSLCLPVILIILKQIFI